MLWRKKEEDKKINRKYGKYQKLGQGTTTTDETRRACKWGEVGTEQNDKHIIKLIQSLNRATGTNNDLSRGQNNNNNIK